MAGSDRLTLDISRAMADRLGSGGIGREALQALGARMQRILRQLDAQRRVGDLGFCHLPHDRESAQATQRYLPDSLNSFAIQLPRPPQPIRPSSILEFACVPKATDGLTTRKLPTTALDIKLLRFIISLQNSAQFHPMYSGINNLGRRSDHRRPEVT